MSKTAETATLQHVITLLESGRAGEAERSARQATTRFPQCAEMFRLHGVTLLQLGQVAQGRRILEKAQRMDPHSVATACNLASAMLAMDEADAAVRLLEEARRQQPGNPAVLATLGNALLGSGRPDDAAHVLKQALHQVPGNPGLMLNLAAAQLECGHADDAHQHVRDALRLVPDHPEAHSLMGHVLAAQQDYAAAAQAWSRAQQIDPHDATHAYQRGLMLDELGRYDAAAQAWQQALGVDPSLHAAASQLLFALRRLCRWDGTDALGFQLLEGIGCGADGIMPFAFLAEDHGAAWQLRCATNHARSIEQAARPIRARSPAHAPKSVDARLRVGFVSNGFTDHPTGLLTVALFEAMRLRGSVELHLFASGGRTHSVIRDRLKAAAHGWHDIAAMNDHAAAQYVRAQDIEILVDLRGYGGGSLAAMLALRPAPIQVNWLAYPGTSGAPWIDYVIADEVTIPASRRDAFSECVAWLPRCFQPSDTSRPVPAAPSRSQCGLPDVGTVYACFNNSYKLNQPSFERFLEILQRVPGSVLWLLSGPQDADQRLRDHAQRRAIDPRRLVFMSKLPHPEYLARYQLADLFLDTLPYNAHTTASDALWAGCPVLTLPGNSFAGRVAASLNHHLGMPELIASSADDFVQRATHIGTDAAHRSALRARLHARKQASSLFDMDGFGEDLERLLQRMAHRHRSGKSPRDLPAG